MEPLAPAAASGPRTNRQIEDLAIAFVIAQEALEGRIAKDTRYTGAPADVTSADRIIEVKAYGGSARGADLWLETRQIDEANKNSDRFWLYVVDNLRQGDRAKFRLLRFGGSQLKALLDRAVERRYYSVPFPVGVYDAALSE